MIKEMNSAMANRYEGKIHRTALIIVIFLINTMFAQIMIVEDDFGAFQYQKISNINKITFGTPPSFSKCGDIVSYEGNYYETIQIGTQCWFKENLNLGKRIDGTSEQTSTDTDIEKYCFNDDTTNCTTYGGLYQWAEAMAYEDGASNTATNTFADDKVQGICPPGWHIPTETEFDTLSATVSGSSNALKAVGQGADPGAGTNSSGFSGLLAGLREQSDGSSKYLGKYNYFWSSTGFNSTTSRMMNTYKSDDVIRILVLNKLLGLSVRCLKD